MATYTDVDKFRVDFYKVQDDEVFERFATRAAVFAYDLINSYLYEIYTVPFATTPAEIKNISDLITRYVAQSLVLKQPMMLVREEAEGDMLTALDWLFNIATGKAGLVGYSRLTTRGPSHNMDSYIPIFDLDDPEYNRPDPDYMDHVSDRRDQ